MKSSTRLRQLSWPRLRHELDVYLDARKTVQQRPFLRRPVDGVDHARTALTVSLTGFPYQLKVEAILLKALQLHGLAPAVVTSRALARRARWIFGAFGIERLVFVDDWQAEIEQDARRAMTAFLAEPVTVQRLKAFSYRNANVGRQVLSTLSRHLYEGMVDLSTPQANSLLHPLLSEAIRNTLLAERLFDDVAPEVVIFNEARYAAYGGFFDTALSADLNVLQFVHGYSEDALMLKRYTQETRGLHPRSLSEATWRSVCDEPWTPAMQRELDAQFATRYSGHDLLSRRIHHRARERTGDQLRSELVLDPGKKTVVVFSHVLWDANLFYGEDLFADQEEWLVETVRAAVANPEVNWVVKLHPANTWKLLRDGFTGELAELRALRSAVGDLPEHVTLLLPDTDVSTLSLFAVADVGVTIRGTIGMELPCLGVNVLTAGTSHYAGRGFTVDSVDADEYLQRLRSVQDLPRLGEAQILLARKHAHAIFCRRPLTFTTWNTTTLPLEQSGHPLDHNIEVLVDSWEELDRAPDLREFAEWAVDRERLDYLRPVEECDELEAGTAAGSSSSSYSSR